MKSQKDLAYFAKEIVYERCKEEEVTGYSSEKMKKIVQQAVDIKEKK